MVGVTHLLVLTSYFIHIACLGSKRAKLQYVRFKASHIACTVFAWNELQKTQTSSKNTLAPLFMESTVCSEVERDMTPGREHLAVQGANAKR